MSGFRGRVFAVAGVVAWFALLSAGCSEQAKTVQLAPAEGFIQINGRPAVNILVQFLPQVPAGEPGPTSTGVTDAEGKFEMATADGQMGAVVGPCKVLLTDMEEERPRQGQPMTKPPRLPSNYSVLGPQTMEVEVKPGSEPFIINVRS